MNHNDIASFIDESDWPSVAVVYMYKILPSVHANINKESY